MMCSYKLLIIFSVCFSLVFALSLKESPNKKVLNKRAVGDCITQRCKVLILGAGMAGINAAKTLYDAGITDFRVLEATDRIGGRLLLEEFGGGAVELGGNWVHGTDFNPIWSLVEKAGLNHVDTMIKPEEGKYIVLDKDGNDVTGEDGHEKMKEVEECLEELVEDNRGKQDFSVRDGLTKCEWYDTTPAQTSIEYYNHDFDSAVPPEQISCGAMLRSGGAIDSTGGQQALISDRNGYETIIKNLATEFMGQVQKNSLVNNIELGNGEVKVSVAVRENPQLQEQEATTKTMKADFVLVTFSIGVLREKLSSMFTPGLISTEFEQSLYKMKMANYLKIFMHFSERFWTPNVDYMFYASTDRGFYPVWQNYGTLAHGGIPENDNILLVTVTGDKADQFGVEEDSKTTIKNDLWGNINVPGVLKIVFKAKIAELTEQGKEPELLDIKLRNWKFDPQFLGAYSNPTVETTSADFNTLLKPVAKGRVFFAGEGLSELYYGFLHGAYLTGEDQAKKIIGIIQFQEGQLGLEGLNYVLRKSIGKPGNGTKH